MVSHWTTPVLHAVGQHDLAHSLLEVSATPIQTHKFVNPAHGAAFARQQPRGLGKVSMSYVPDGMTKEQYAKIKAKDKKRDMPGKFNGTSGMKFRSRTMEEFQTLREQGKVSYNMPMENAEAKLRRGEIKPSDIPYMQRPGGMPDGSDLKKGFKFP